MVRTRAAREVRPKPLPQGTPRGRGVPQKSGLVRKDALAMAYGPWLMGHEQGWGPCVFGVCVENWCQQRVCARARIGGMGGLCTSKGG